MKELQAFDSVIPEKKEQQRKSWNSDSIKHTNTSRYYNEPFVAATGAIIMLSGGFSIEGESITISTFVSSGLEMEGLRTACPPAVLPAALFIRLFV
jgi:hypothetical protein